MVLQAMPSPMPLVEPATLADSPRSMTSSFNGRGTAWRRRFEGRPSGGSAADSGWPCPAQQRSHSRTAYRMRQAIRTRYHWPRSQAGRRPAAVPGSAVPAPNHFELDQMRGMVRKDGRQSCTLSSFRPVPDAARPTGGECHGSRTCGQQARTATSRPRDSRTCSATSCGRPSGHCANSGNDIEDDSPATWPQADRVVSSAS
jgi:hypothetical protein